MNNTLEGVDMAIPETYTCDECKAFRMIDGFCKKHDVFRHSCGEDACDAFELAVDLKGISEFEERTKKEGGK